MLLMTGAYSIISVVPFRTRLSWISKDPLKMAEDDRDPFKITPSLHTLSRP
jgi:hypothetical protein